MIKVNKSTSQNRVRVELFLEGFFVHQKNRQSVNRQNCFSVKKYGIPTQTFYVFLVFCLNFTVVLYILSTCSISFHMLSDLSRKFSHSIVNHQQPFFSGVHHVKDDNENFEPHLIDARPGNDQVAHSKLTVIPLHTSDLNGVNEYRSLPVSSSSPFQDVPSKCVNLKSHFIQLVRLRGLYKFSPRL